MTLQEEQKYLASKVNPVECKKHGVTIVIGRAVDILKPMLRGANFYSMTKADEVRDFLERNSMASEGTLFMEDLSLMTPAVQSFLLKFIEEPLMPLVILASKDNISPIILSRCKRIIKLPCTEVPNPQLVKQFVETRIQLAEEIKTAQRLGEQVPHDVLESYSNVEGESLLKCCDYMYLVTRMKTKKSNISNPDKYLELMQ